MIYENIVLEFSKKNLILLSKKEECKNTKSKVVVSNGKYKAVVKFENYIGNNTKNEPSWFYRNNPYIIENLNQFLKDNTNGQYTCVSTFEQYNDRDTYLEFVCNNCGEHINQTLFNVLRMRNDDYHNGICCPRCGGKTESLHALVLKQLFVHFYPDTILEDKSCINPNTGKIMPTDIVNHGLKMAIEIQGQYHRFERQKVKDGIKKNFWIEKGYTFYDYSIDKTSVLDYCRLFFADLVELPNWINYDYANKLNLNQIQNDLNSGMKVAEIANKYNISNHRIYDALYRHNLYYPKSYQKSTKKIVQLDKDKNFIKIYNSYKEAEESNNITKGLISSCIYYKRFYSSGYYWYPLEIYEKIA